MKVQITIELDDCYQEQIFENTVYDQRDNKRKYEDALAEHTLRAVLEQMDGIEDSKGSKSYNSDSVSGRHEMKVDLLRMCEEEEVTVKVTS